MSPDHDLEERYSNGAINRVQQQKWIKKIIVLDPQNKTNCKIVEQDLVGVTQVKDVNGDWYFIRIPKKKKLELGVPIELSVYLQKPTRRGRPLSRKNYKKEINKQEEINQSGGTQNVKATQLNLLQQPQPMPAHRQPNLVYYPVPLTQSAPATTFNGQPIMQPQPAHQPVIFQQYPYQVPMVAPPQQYHQAQPTNMYPRVNVQQTSIATDSSTPPTVINSTPNMNMYAPQMMSIPHPLPYGATQVTPTVTNIQYRYTTIQPATHPTIHQQLVPVEGNAIPGVIVSDKELVGTKNGNNVVTEFTETEEI